MKESTGVWLGLMLVALLASPQDVRSEERLGAQRIDPREIQRIPRTRADPTDGIDRGSAGLLEEDRDRDLAEGQGSEKAETADMEILPEACEAELALSAAPEHLRAGAGLFVLRDEGYERVRDSKNGFDCIVNRDHPRVIKPTCFDAEGAATIVPKILDVGLWLLEGLSATEIQQRVEYGFVSGQYSSPSRSGVAYMLSNFNRPWYPRSQTLGLFPPHVMFYAPDLSGEDIGFDAEAFSGDRSLPLIGYQGPHGFIIMITGENRERARGELRRCPAWVWN